MPVTIKKLLRPRIIGNFATMNNDYKLQNRHPVLIQILVCAFFVLPLYKISAGETKKDTLFIGVEWSVEISAPTWSALDQAEIQAIALTSVLGRFEIFPALPVRARLGLAWFPGKEFRLAPGLEIAFLELLQASGARMLGLYGLLDLGLAPFSTDSLRFTSRLGLLLPTGPSGGLLFAAGVDEEGAPLASLTFMIGGYTGR
ncbi:hypothetical protein MASR2M78_22250 [Treponema sp.]